MHFKGPFHFKHLQQLKKNNKIENGIYIWGFVYEFDETGLTEPVDYTKEPIPLFNTKGANLPTDQKFIPYYVGMRTKYEVFDRLNDHHSLTGKSTKKYTRLSYPFLKEFFKGIHGFPIIIPTRVK